MSTYEKEKGTNFGERASVITPVSKRERLLGTLRTRLMEE